MISVIIASNKPERFSAIRAHYQSLFGPELHEIVGIHDARSLCEAYNRGLRVARGDIVVFSHDDIEIVTPAFAPRLKGHLETYDLIGVAGARRACGPRWFDAGPAYLAGQVGHVFPNGIWHVGLFGIQARIIPGIKVMDGLFLAFRREVIETLRWDEATFNGFHCYDVDVSLRAALAGYKTAVVLDIPIVHYSHGNFGPAWNQAAQTFLQKHQAHLEPPGYHSYAVASTHFSTKEETVRFMNSLVEEM
jgi:hypothetical protein